MKTGSCPSVHPLDGVRVVFCADVGHGLYDYSNLSARETAHLTETADLVFAHSGIRVVWRGERKRSCAAVSFSMITSVRRSTGTPTMQNRRKQERHPGDPRRAMLIATGNRWAKAGTCGDVRGIRSV